MFVGSLEFDILLGDVHSLKQKRSVVRPILTELRRFDISVAEVADHDLHRRAKIGVAVTASGVGHVTELLDRCERTVAARPEIQLLSARRRVWGPDD